MNSFLKYSLGPLGQLLAPSDGPKTNPSVANMASSTLGPIGRQIMPNAPSPSNQASSNPLSMLAGPLGGALTGGGLGNLSGPLGNLLPSSVGEALTGTPSKKEKEQLYTPEQEQILNQLLAMGAKNMDFGPIEQRARTGFAQTTIPALAERFTSMGEGAQRSGAFAGRLGAASSGLESSLAALRAQYAMPMMQMGLTPRYATQFFPATPGILQNAAAGLTSGQGLAALLPFLLAL